MAIVVYREANALSIASILLSMLSVASKSFVFSIATATNLKQLLLNWLCAITDFFGIFFVVSWAFYEPHSDELSGAFALIRNVWLYKLIVGELVMIGGGAICTYLGTAIALSTEFLPDICCNRRRTCCDRVGYSFFWLLFFALLTFMLFAGVIALTLSLEILNCTYLAGTLWHLGTTRFSDSKSATTFWQLMINWINSAQRHRVGSRYNSLTSFTKAQDRMMRICSLNHVLAKHKSDPGLRLYLERHAKESQYLNVTMRGIRTNAKNAKKAQFLQKFWFGMYGMPWNNVRGDLSRQWQDWNNGGGDFEDFVIEGSICVGVTLATFVFGPIYLVSRVATLLFPGFIVLYLYFAHDVNIWTTDLVDAFQRVMISTYLALCVALSILFYMNCCEQYLTAHFAPSYDWVNPSCDLAELSVTRLEELSSRVTDHYYGMVVVPIRRAMVTEKFGSDLAPIILSYLPLEDHYAGADTQSLKPKIVI